MTKKSVDGNFNIAEDVHDVLSSWLASKKSIPDSWKKETKRIKAMPYAKANALGTYGCSTIVSRARRTRNRLKALSDILTEVTSAIQSKAEAAQINFERVNNMYGLVALPNELLVRIFRSVVNDDPNTSHSTRWRAALTLSHVYQHFREIALSCPHLWTSVGENKAMTALCFQRSKNAPLDVDLSIICDHKSNDWHYEQIFLKVHPLAHRWKSLHIGFKSKYRSNDPQKQAHVRGTEVNENVDAPLLESLNIEKLDLSSRIQPHTFKHWNTPNLRHLTSKHFFPISLPGLCSVTVLEITLLPKEVKFSDLLEDLSRMTALEDFTFKLERDPNCFGLEHHEVGKFARVKLRSVRRLKIETEVEHEHEFIDESPVTSLKRNFFSSLSFPGVLDLYIRLWGDSNEEGNRYDDNSVTDVDFGDELGCILLRRKQFARVTNFHLEVFGESRGLKGKAKRGRNSVCIPLNVLPDLKNLTVRSNRALWIGCPEERRGCDRDDDDMPPGIQTITIDTPHPRTTLSCVTNVLREQFVCDRFDEFRELITLGYDDTTAEDDSGDSEDGEAAPRKKVNVIKKYGSKEVLSWIETGKITTTDCKP